jgi:hypothetical protein
MIGLVTGKDAKHVSNAWYEMIHGPTRPANPGVKADSFFTGICLIDDLTDIFNGWTKLPTFQFLQRQKQTPVAPFRDLKLPSRPRRALSA